MRLLPILIILLIIPLVQAGICEDELDLTENISCLMLTPSLTCSNYVYDIINMSDKAIVKDDYNLTLLNNSIYFFDFNESVGDYIVSLCDNSTREIKVIREGENMQIAMIIGLGSVAFILLFIAFNLEKEHYLLRIFHIFFALFLLLLIPGSLINGVSSTQDNFLKIMIWVLRIFVVYIFIYLNYVIWVKSKLIDLGLIQRR